MLALSQRVRLPGFLLLYRDAVRPQVLHYRTWRHGHLEYEITVDDPKVFTRPFTIKRERLLSPDTQLLEDVCENERSRARMSGDTGVRLRPDQVAPLAGVYCDHRSRVLRFWIDWNYTGLEAK